MKTDGVAWSITAILYPKPLPGAFEASRVLRRISSCTPRPEDSGGPPYPRPTRMLPCCFRCTLKPSASAMAVSKLYRHFRGARSLLRPTGLSAWAWPILFAADICGNSAMGPRLATGGWLTLTKNRCRFPSRQELSPCLQDAPRFSRLDFPGCASRTNNPD